MSRPFYREPNVDATQALLCECILSSLDRLLSRKAFETSADEIFEFIRTAANTTYVYDPDAPSALGAVADHICDVVVNSSRPVLGTVDLLFTSITVFPCVLDEAFLIALSAQDSISFEELVSNLVPRMLFTIEMGIHNSVTLRSTNPGFRWKLSGIHKGSIHVLHLQTRLCESSQLGRRAHTVAHRPCSGYA